MNRRHFLKTLLAGCAVTATAALPAQVKNDSQSVEASVYGYMRCPDCGQPMVRIEEDGQMFVTCCGKTYKEPTIPLERIA